MKSVVKEIQEVGDSSSTNEFNVSCQLLEAILLRLHFKNLNGFKFQSHYLYVQQGYVIDELKYK